MPSALRSSRRRYESYREQAKQRRSTGATQPEQTPSSDPQPAPDTGGKRRLKRSRSFGALFVAFWGLLRGHRRAFVWIALAAGISTLLGLAPLYGTKIVFDSVLREQPLPTGLPRWI